jgi:hypothetical protein
LLSLHPPIVLLLYRDCQVKHYPMHKARCGKDLASAIPTPEFKPPGPPPPLFGARLQLLRTRSTAESGAFYHYLDIFEAEAALSKPHCLDLKPVGVDGSADEVARQRYDEALKMLEELVAASSTLPAKKMRKKLVPFLLLALKSCGLTATPGDEDDALHQAAFMSVQLERDFGLEVGHINEQAMMVKGFEEVMEAWLKAGEAKTSGVEEVD